MEHFDGVIRSRVQDIDANREENRGSPRVSALGAIRSIEQCTKCHGGKRGDLLGAFSYSLARTP